MDEQYCFCINNADFYVSECNHNWSIDAPPSGVNKKDVQRDALHDFKRRGMDNLNDSSRLNNRAMDMARSWWFPKGCPRTFADSFPSTIWGNRSCPELR